MMDQVSQAARNVVRIASELQFIGRRLAIPHRENEKSGITYIPAPDERMISFDPMPLLVLLAELFDPDADTIKLQLRLAREVNFSVTKGWLLPDAGDRPKVGATPPDPIFLLPSTLENYFRPDGTCVTRQWGCGKLCDVPVEVCGVGPEMLARLLGIGEDEFCVLHVLAVGSHPMYVVICPGLPSRQRMGFSGPVARFLLQRPFDESTFSPDIDYTVTDAGLAALAAEQTDTVVSSGEKPGESAVHEPRLAPAVMRAYQSWECAEKALADRHDSPIRDKDAYDWLQENGDHGEGYRLPSFDTWQRQVRLGRAAYDKRKNEPRAGRAGRSTVPKSQL